MAIDCDTFNGDARFHGVKGLIRVGGNIIVIRRDTGNRHYQLQLDLPGGGREDHESPFETLAREVREELGIMLRPDDVVYAKRYPHSLSRDEDTFFMVTKELVLDTHSIVFGEKGLMYHIITPHEFIHHPQCVQKQKERIVEYLDAVRHELIEHE